MLKIIKNITDRSIWLIDVSLISTNKLIQNGNRCNGDENVKNKEL